jgi:hypothetical protein
MSPRLNNWASYFKSSQPQADATSSTVPLKDSSSPNDQMPKDTHDQNKFNWDSNLDPSLAEFSTSHPPEKNTVRFGSTTFHPAEDAIKDPSDSSDRGGEDGEGGVDDGSDGSVAEVMDVIDGGDDESENHLGKPLVL